MSKKLKKAKHPISLESRYARALSAGWMLRLMERGVPVNQDFVSCLDWCICGLRPLLVELKKTVLTEHGISERILTEENNEQTDSGQKIPSKALARREQVINALKALLLLIESQDDIMYRKLDVLLEEHANTFLSNFKELAVKYCEKYSVPPRVPQFFKNGESHLKYLFSLDENALKICIFTFIINAFSPAEDYFSDSIELDQVQGRRTLAHVLGIPVGRCRSTIADLQRLGILESSHYYLRLEDAIFDLWDESDTDKAIQQFCRPLTGETLPLSAFPLPKGDVEHVLALLRSKLGKNTEKPVHILLYGPPGTGKTTFAKTLAKELGVRAWSVPSRYDDEEYNRRASLHACITLASRHPGAFVLADEAERLLDSSIHSTRNSHDKAWINELMEYPGRRMIWVTNQVEHIEQAVRRRFTYSLHFENLGLSERRDLWLQILERHGALEKMPQNIMKELLDNYTPPAAVMNEAVLQSKILYGNKKKSQAFASSVLRIVQAHDTLRRNGHKSLKKGSSIEKFTLDGVSLVHSRSKNTTEEINLLLGRLRQADKQMRAGKSNQACTLLFYGPPGTGKSALARYIAEELGRDCILKKASDLLGPYVGETEYNIAAAFSEAERNHAVLIIDEADSFIFSRSMAERNWETSMVNEFLTNLEHFKGFCVCTTNRRKDMDKAAMRRFTFKVHFDYAHQEQLNTLYANMLAPLVGSELPINLQTELYAMKKLTPGDFYAVRSRTMFNESGHINHKDMLFELRQELEAKLEKTREIGF